MSHLTSMTSAGSEGAARRPIATGRVVALAAVGVLLLAASVTFFTVTTVRDNALLEDGRRTTGVVVRTVPASEWRFFDAGRIVVRYTVEGTAQTRPIWLDDPAHSATPASRVTVVVDPDDPTRIRTLRDANDPVPWGMPFLLVGVVGAGALVSAGWRVVAAVRRRREASRPVDAGPRVYVDGLDIPPVTPTVPLLGAAWSDERTRRAWSRYQRRALGLCAAAVVVAAVGGVIHQRISAQDADLLAHGVRATGLVVPGGDYGGRSDQPDVVVRFRADDRMHEGVLNGPDPDELPPGTVVTVYYDPHDPSHFRSEANANHSNLVDVLGMVAPPLIACLLLVAGVRALARAWRWRPWLKRQPWGSWVASPARAWGSRGRRRWIVLTGRSPDGDEVEVVLAHLPGFGEGGSWTAQGQPVLYLPGPGAHGVLLASDTSSLIGVQLPSTQRAGRRVRRSRAKHAPPPDAAESGSSTPEEG